jgi:hypothetical protein
LTSEIWHLTIEDLLAPLPETPRLGGPGPFVINLSASTAPISLPVKSLTERADVHVYQVQRTEDRRLRYRLRLGPFETEDEAQVVLEAVREIYPGALTATAETDDLRAIESLRAKTGTPPAGKASSKPTAGAGDMAPRAAEAGSALPEEGALPSTPPPAWVALLASGAAVKEPAPVARAATNGTAIPVLSDFVDVPPPATVSRATAQPTVPQAAPSQTAPSQTRVSQAPVSQAAVAPQPTAPQTPRQLVAPVPATAPPVVDVVVPRPMAESSDVIEFTLEPVPAPIRNTTPKVAPTAAPGGGSAPIAGPGSIPTPIAMGAKPSVATVAAPKVAPKAEHKAAPKVEHKAAPKAALTAEHKAAPTAAAGAVAKAAPVAVSAAVPQARRPVAALRTPLESLEATQTLRPLTPGELKDGTGARWFAIQLAQGDEGFDPDALPNLDIFSEYRLYSVAALEAGKVIHALRLGFFAEESAASAVAGYLASFYDKPVVKRISLAERARFSDQRVEARKDIGATGKHAVIEITDEIVVRPKRAASATVTPIAPRASPPPAKPPERDTR